MTDEELGLRGTGRTLAAALRAIADACETGFCYASDHQIDGTHPSKQHNAMFATVVDRTAQKLGLKVATYFTEDDRPVVQSLYEHSRWRDREEFEKSRKAEQAASIAKIRAMFREITGKELVVDGIA